MAVRNVAMGGTALTDEAGKPSDWNDTFDATVTQIYGDNSGGSINSSTSETDLATITITQNDLNDNATICITTGFLSENTSGAGATATFRLYVNGSIVKTITETGQVQTGRTVTWVATGLDSTAGNIIVKVTGQWSVSHASNILSTEGLMVQGFNR